MVGEGNGDNANVRRRKPATIARKHPPKARNRKLRLPGSRLGGTYIVSSSGKCILISGIFGSGAGDVEREESWSRGSPKSLPSSPAFP